MRIGQYCQRQRCRHVELKKFWLAFASRGFVSDSWAFLLYFTYVIVVLFCLLAFKVWLSAAKNQGCHAQFQDRGRSQTLLKRQYCCLLLGDITRSFAWILSRKCCLAVVMMWVGFNVPPNRLAIGQFKKCLLKHWRDDNAACFELIYTVCNNISACIYFSSCKIVYISKRPNLTWLALENARWQPWCYTVLDPTVRLVSFVCFKQTLPLLDLHRAYHKWETWLKVLFVLLLRIENEQVDVKNSDNLAFCRVLLMLLIGNLLLMHSGLHFIDRTPKFPKVMRIHA